MFAMTLAQRRVKGQRVEGPESWAKELELSVIGNGEPLESCEQDRDMVRFASEYMVWKLVWGNGLVSERPGRASSEEDQT